MELWQILLFSIGIPFGVIVSIAIEWMKRDIEKMERDRLPYAFSYEQASEWEDAVVSMKFMAGSG